MTAHQHPTGPAGRRRPRSASLLGYLTTAVAAITAAALLTAPAARADGSGPSTPDLVSAVQYLTTTTGANGITGGTSLATDGYYDSFTDWADFGLTIDGAYALAATGTDNTTLAKVVNFLDQGTDGSGRSVNDWTNIGTSYAGGGSIGKEALLAEAVGYDPHDFGGQDLIAALDSIVCTGQDTSTGCAAAGNYSYATSIFSQALGIMAQIRAGDAANAAAPVAYLESLQNSDGGFPSLIPPGSNPPSDVDSTGMAAMALALLPDDSTASTAVSKAAAWIAAQQESDGGFPGAAGDSTNSAALAIMGLRLAGSQYATQIGKALAFLAGQQNSDGGFNVAAGGQVGSDVRASTQVVSGIVGTSFAALNDDIAPPKTITTTTVTDTDSVTAGTATTLTATVAPTPDGGTVAFTAAGSPVSGCSGQPVSAGIATCTTAFAATGPVTVAARFGGTTGYATSTGLLNLTVAPAATGPGDGSGTVTSTVPAGGSAASSSAAPSTTTPVVASVTSPNAGTVTFTPGGPGAGQGGYTMLGHSFVITAPAASAAAPLQLSFAFDDASLPAGSDPSQVTVFRDGVAVPACASPSATTADPDPCVASSNTAAGVTTVTVLSSHASTWTFGTRDQTAPSVKRVKVAAGRAAEVGGRQRIAVRVWNDDGSLAANAVVRVRVSGANAASGSARTGAHGELGTFYYSPTRPGRDAVTATVAGHSASTTVVIARPVQIPVLSAVSRHAGTVNVAVQTHPVVQARKIRIYYVSKVRGHKAELVACGGGMTDATGRAHVVISLPAGQQFVLKARMAGRDHVERLSNRYAVGVRR